MKHWNETAAVLERVAELSAARRNAAIATVVRIAGSAYRRPGAKLLIEDDGRTQGGVSGGCLEADVREAALNVMRTRIPRLLHYDTGEDDRSLWGVGLGCLGSIDVFVQPTVTAIETLQSVRALLTKDAPFAICTVVGGPDRVGDLSSSPRRMPLQSRPASRIWIMSWRSSHTPRWARASQEWKKPIGAWCSRRC